MEKLYIVTFSYAVDVIAENEKEAYQKAVEQFIALDPKPTEMNEEIEEVVEWKKQPS